MMIYNIIRNNAALSTTTDFLSLIAGATRSLLVLEIDAQGDGTASAANEIGIYRVTTAGVTASGAIAPQPVDAPNMTGTTPAIAFSGLVWTGWTTQPVVATTPLHTFGVNANGQRYFWRSLPNLSNAIVVPGGNNAAAALSVRSILGTSNMSLRLQVAEL